MLEHNLICDYENCTQRYLSEPHNWWSVVQRLIVDALEISPLLKLDYDQIIDADPYKNDRPINEKHFCCVDHAIKYTSRLMAEFKNPDLQPREEAETPAGIAEDDIPF